jgi:hypothetical protein
MAQPPETQLAEAPGAEISPLRRPEIAAFDNVVKALWGALSDFPQISVTTKVTRRAICCAAIGNREPVKPRNSEAMLVSHHWGRNLPPPFCIGNQVLRPMEVVVARAP